MGEAEDAVARFVDRMPLLQKPFEERRLVFTPGTPLDFYGAGDGKLHANGAEFHIKGINWYGTEGKQMMLEGLSVRPLGRLLDFLVEHQFNAMRLLFNMQDWRDDSEIPQDHFSAFLNPELVGLRYRAMLLHITRAAAQKGIMVMLACHRLRRFYSDGIHAEWPSGWDGWWFDNKARLGFEKVESLWTEISRYYCGEWNLFAADIFNEPSQARWNTRRENDWGDAAGRYGNAVLNGCPRLLVFVQGAGRQNGNGPTDTCWGGSFTDARAIMSPSPVPRLRNQSKLVLSPHAYGPSLYKLKQTKQWMPQQFKQPTDRYVQALPDKWDQIWGFAPDTGLRPPLVLSEVGGDMTCCDFRELNSPGADAAWQVELIEYLHRKSAGLFYFCLNPYSDDTGGIIQKDFRTPETHKLKMLSAARSTKRTLGGATIAALLVTICVARGKFVARKPAKSGRAVKPRPPKRAVGGGVLDKARGMLSPAPSAGTKRAAGKKRGKKTRKGESPEEAVALAIGDAEEGTLEEGALGAAPINVASPKRPTEEPTCEQWAQKTQLDEEFEAIIRKHSTLRAARLAKP